MAGFVKGLLIGCALFLLAYTAGVLAANGEFEWASLLSLIAGLGCGWVGVAAVSQF